MTTTAHRPTSAFIYLMAALLFVALPANAASPKNASRQALIRATDIDTAASLYGFQVLETSASGVYLVGLPNGTDASKLASQAVGDGNVTSVEPAAVAYLQGAELDSHGILAQQDVVESLARFGYTSTPCLDTYLATPALAVWASQPAAARIAVEQAQTTAGGCGEGVTVAIIDTGVDAGHEILVGAIAPGYDFLSGQSLTSGNLTTEQSVLGQPVASSRAIVEASSRAIVEGGDTAIVQLQTMAPILAAEDALILTDVDLPPFYGHGTMVAGLIRLVAPAAQIMPLRVFDDYGEAHAFDIVRAVYLAVDSGADVINMSFSMENPSRELAEALRYARSQGVVTVAAAGNQGERARIYPAALPGVVGVAATDDDDNLASFSNFGTSIAHLAAPGVATISSYPGGLYAAGWGTSFGSPLTAATIALQLQVSPTFDTASQQDAVLDLLAGTDFVEGLQGEVLAGRLNSHGAVLEAQN